MDAALELICLHENDNVAIARSVVVAGTTVSANGRSVLLLADIEQGHKVAILPIAADAKILKFGVSIGSATRSIAPGEHVHLHNLRSDYTATHLEGGVKPVKQ